MDKKAWTAITLCLVLMGVNFWFSTQNIEKAKQEAAAKAAAAPASAVSKPAEGAPPVPPPAAATVTPAAPLTAAANLPEEKHELKVGTVTYQFSTRGGGVTRAILAGHDKVELNKHGREAIGALRREATSTDLTPYKILEKDDTHIVFQGLTAEAPEELLCPISQNIMQEQPVVTPLRTSRQWRAC
jgi:hypothetical protein